MFWAEEYLGLPNYYLFCSSYIAHYWTELTFIPYSISPLFRPSVRRYLTQLILHLIGRLRCRFLFVIECQIREASEMRVKQKKNKIIENSAKDEDVQQRCRGRCRRTPFHSKSSRIWFVNICNMLLVDIASHRAVTGCAYNLTNLPVCCNYLFQQRLSTTTVPVMMMVQRAGRGAILSALLFFVVDCRCM